MIAEFCGEACQPREEKAISNASAVFPRSMTFRGERRSPLFRGVLARVDESERDRHAKRPTLGAEAKQSRVIGAEYDRRYDVSGLHSAAAEADP